MHLFLPFSQVKWPKTYLNSIYPVQPNNLLETLHIFAGPSKYHPPMSPKNVRTETESRELNIRGKNQKYMATPKKIEQFNQNTTLIRTNIEQKKNANLLAYKISNLTFQLPECPLQ